jgi:hypothetical protein
VTALPPIRGLTIARPGLSLALAFTAALAPGACAPGPSVPDPRPSVVSPTGRSPSSDTPTPSPSRAVAGPTGLWLLVGTPGSMRLVRSIGDRTGPARDRQTEGLPLDARWVSGDTTHGFVATVGATGRILTLHPTGAGSTGPPGTWKRVDIRPAAGSTDRGGPSFAALSLDGRSIAATVGDPTSGAVDAGLIVVDRTGARATVTPLDGRLDGHPPVWLGDTTVAVPILDRSDAATIAFVDRAGGRVTHRPGLGGSLAASTDGGFVAMSSRGGDRVVAGRSTDLGGSDGWVDVVGASGFPDPTDRAAQVLLDATGARLAVAWLDAAGEASTVTTYRIVGAGWVPAGVVALPGGATRVALVGFDP